MKRLISEAIMPLAIALALVLLLYLLIAG